jgi:hypothetical protein
MTSIHSIRLFDHTLLTVPRPGAAARGIRLGCAAYVLILRVSRRGEGSGFLFGAQQLASLTFTLRDCIKVPILLPPEVALGL